MKHQCVSEHNPGYPTKEDTLLDPILLRNTPARWKGIALVCSAFSILTLSSCSFVQNKIKGITNGTGSQWTSGIAVAPVYHLSEDEVIEIIADEAALNGLEFDIANDYNVNVNMPINIKINEDNLEYEYSELKTKLTVDGKAKDKNICFEYISDEDYKELIGEEKVNDLTYHRIEFMNKYLQTKDNGTIQSDKGELVKIFYDRYKGKEKNEAEEVLRQQVREYIEQLKASGVI